MSRRAIPMDIMGDVLNNASGAAVEVPMALIDDNPFQERSEYGELDDLASDIREHGLLQPPIVRPMPDGRYQLAFGHRRKRACELAGLATIPVMVRSLDDDRMATIAYSENDKRTDVSAIDRARSIQRMIERFGWTHQQVADKLSIARPTVSNLLRLLRAPEEVQQAVATGEISERQAAAMMPAFDLPPEALKRVSSKETAVGYSLDNLISQAKAGQSSDNLRERASMVVKAATQSLAGRPWTTTDLRRLDVHHFVCNSCPAKIIATGGEERCADVACFEIKQQAWADYETAALVEAAGVPGMPLKVRYDEYQSFWGEDKRLAEEHGLNKAPLCERLRVARGGDGLKIEGVDGGTLVCYHQGKRCECLAKIKKDLSKDGRRQWTRIREQTMEALTAALTAPTQDTLRILAGFFAPYNKRDEVGSWRMEDVISVIAKAVIEQVQPYEADKRVDEARAVMEKLLARGYITPPWSMMATLASAPDPVQKMRGRVEVIRAWIGTQTVKNGAPSREELERIADNCRECLHDLIALPNGVERDEMAQLLSAAELSASEMINLVADGFDGSKDVSWLVNTPISDVNAKGALTRADRADLVWALAVCRVFDQKKTTIEAIRSELRKRDRSAVVVVHPSGWPTTTERKATDGYGYIEPTVDREAPDYIDAKLQRIAGWIDDYQAPGDGLPTPESVAGNFANLEKLLESIIGQQSEADQLKLKLLYDEVYSRLAALSDRVQQSYSTYPE